MVLWLLVCSVSGRDCWNINEPLGGRRELWWGGGGSGAKQRECEEMASGAVH